MKMRARYNYIIMLFIKIKVFLRKLIPVVGERGGLVEKPEDRFWYIKAKM